MRKITIIVFIFALILVACDQSSIQLNNSSKSTEEQVTVLKIKQIDTIASVYGDEALVNEITILSAEEVLSVKEVYIENDKIINYKVELKYGTIGYVKAEDFYIIDTLTEDYVSYLTPTINIDHIQLGEVISSNSFIESYMTYNLYVDDLLVEDTFNFIEGMRYDIYAVAFDRYDAQYVSEIKVLDTEVNRIYCKVREDKDVESKELTRFLNYSDYKNRVINCEISYKNGQIESWYAIQLDDGTVGYSNDELYHINDIDKLIVKTKKESIEIDQSDFSTFKSMPSVIRINSQTSDELHLIDFASGSHKSYLGDSRFYEDNIFVVEHYKQGDDSYKQLSMILYENEVFNEVVTIDNNFSGFTNINQVYNRNVDFVAHFNKNFYWPLTQMTEYKRSGSFELWSSGYRLKYQDDVEFDEPLLENVVLYKNILDKTEQIGTFSSVDISSVHNEKRLDIDNEQIVCWFKIVTVDGQEGYAYRPLFDYELNSIDISGYQFMLSDGSEYSYLDFELYYNTEFYQLTNDLAAIDMYTFLINRGYVEYNVSVDRDAYDLKYKKMVTESAKLLNKEMIVSKYYGEYYDMLDASELTIYELIDEDYKAYCHITINNAKSGHFIWLDENTISFFIIESNYKYDLKQYPSVLRRVNNKWLIESTYTDFDIK